MHAQARFDACLLRAGESLTFDPAATMAGGPYGQFQAVADYEDVECNRRDERLAGVHRLRLFAHAGRDAPFLAQGLQRYYRRHGLQLHRSPQSSTVEVPYVLDNDQAGLQEALRCAFPGVDLDAVLVAALVCVSRLYVGVHLPLDVVGGAALGWAAGSLVHLLMGAPGGRPSAERATKALRERGLEVTEVTPLGGRDARRSARFQAVGPGGEPLFAKLIPRERRDEDLLYRSWRMLLRRRAEPGRRNSGPPLQQVEREAYLGLLAASAGVSTPGVVLAGPYGNGSGLLVQRLVPGRSLGEADPAAVGDATLKATWEEVARLHQAGIAHGDLGRDSVVVDPDGRPWLVDFDHAIPVAPERLRQADLTELLVSLAVRFGPDRAVVGATDALGRDALAAALAAATPSALTRMTREELEAHPTLWDDLARRVTPAVEQPPAPGAAVRRRSSGPSR